VLITITPYFASARDTGGVAKKKGVQVEFSMDEAAL
jgi:hypothetical protein